MALFASRACVRARACVRVRACVCVCGGVPLPRVPLPLYRQSITAKIPFTPYIQATKQLPIILVDILWDFAKYRQRRL